MEDQEFNVPARELDRGYASQWELMDDIFAWLDLTLYFFYRRHQWVGPKNDLRNMMGLVVSREEFEHNLTKAAQRGLNSRLDALERAQLSGAVAVIRTRLSRTAERFPLIALPERCGLDAFDRGCLAMSYAVALDGKYEKRLAYLQDDINRKLPTVSLATQLFLPEGENMEGFLSRFYRRDAFTALFDSGELAAGTLLLRPLVLEFLSTGEIARAPGLRLFDGKRHSPAGPLVTDTEIAKRLDVLTAEPGKRAVCITGGPGSGKRLQVEHLCVRRGSRCIFVDLDCDDRLDRAADGVLAARMTGADIAFGRLESPDRDGGTPTEPRLIRDIMDLEPSSDNVFFLTESPMRVRLERVTVELDIPETDEDGRIRLFKAYLGDMPLEDSVTVEELAAKFRFSPRQVEAACREAVGVTRLDGGDRVSAEEIHRCCFRQAVHRLGDLARRVRPNFGWDDVVMPEEQKELLRRAVGHIKYKYRVYNQWGFDKKIAYGRGLSVLFAGAPGTGKTMCAQVIATELNMEMYKINISQIVSKYIGETEKNLHAVFTEARKSNCILFFDECDALFGKRGEVKDANDRNANVEVAYLLQQIEEYDGVCIMATNLIGNMDEAFMRRVTYVVRFPFPDARAREEIYRRTVPDVAPVSDDIDWAFLAERFELAGGHIKNIVLSAAFMAAGAGEPIGMRHLLKAAVGEMKKNGIVVVREELREYADLLDS